MNFGDWQFPSGYNYFVIVADRSGKPREIHNYTDRQHAMHEIRENAKAAKLFDKHLFYVERETV